MVSNRLEVSVTLTRSWGAYHPCCTSNKPILAAKRLSNSQKLHVEQGPSCYNLLARAFQAQKSIIT